MREPSDPLLRSLRDLAQRDLTVESGEVSEHLRARARVELVRAFEGSPWYARAARAFGRAAVPVFLAGVVGIYMLWAVGAASAVMR